MKHVKSIANFLKSNQIGFYIYVIVVFKHFRDHYPDLNWDRANYADYTVYSLFNNRWKNDWFVGGLNNYNNPISSIPGYLFSIGGGLLGFLFLGCLLLSIYYYASRIIEILFSTHPNYKNCIVKSFSTNILLLGPLFLSEVGTTMGDWPLILLMISSIYYFLRFIFNSNSWGLISISVFLMTLATMLKTSNAIFLGSFLITLLLTLNSKHKLLIFVKGFVFGFFPAVFLGGMWMFRVFIHTGNPIFPYYNEVFKSEYFPQVNFRDRRWEVNSPLEFFAPWTGLWGPSNLEFTAFDSRITMLLILVAFISLRRVFSSESLSWKNFLDRQRVMRASPLKLILVYTLISYILWAWLLFYARYAMPIELLVGILLIYAINSIFRSLRNLKYALLVSFMVTLLSIVPNWNLYQSDYARSTDTNLNYQGDPRFQVQNEELSAGNSTFLLIGTHLGYLVRSSNPSNNFIRVELGGTPTALPTYYKEKITDTNAFLLTNEDPKSYKNLNYQKEVVSEFSLSFVPEKCREYNSINERYWICTLNRGATN
jgi:hypothetical protein